MTEEIKKEKYPNIDLSIGQLGCGLSHLNIVKNAVKNNLQTVPGENFATDLNQKWPYDKY
jgi:hypothetical protein